MQKKFIKGENMIDAINRLTMGQNLTTDQAQQLFESLVEGKLNSIEITALLIALKTKGETADEILGAVRALRKAAGTFDRPDYPFADSCGTGGDGAHTINISTAAAFVAAQMKIPVVKHGNRSVSSKCGSADVLENLKIKPEIQSDVAKKCLDKTGICFLYAPLYHSGLKYAGPVRKTLGIRTIMNVLGPMLNPALPTHQLMGVYSSDLCEPAAEVLNSLGCTALVVHGSGLDEISVCNTTRAVLAKDGRITSFTITPQDAGLPVFNLSDLKGGDANDNSRILKDILQGNGQKAHNAAVAINAGALAWIFGLADNLKEGTSMALEVINSGKSYELVHKLEKITNGS
jgi:anthranilate phosphoribosyltransferase